VVAQKQGMVAAGIPDEVQRVLFLNTPLILSQYGISSHQKQYTSQVGDAA